MKAKGGLRNLRILEVRADIDHLVDVAHQKYHLHDGTLPRGGCPNEYREWLDLVELYLFDSTHVLNQY